MLQVAITLELTAPRPWRSQGTTSGNCQWCPRLEDPPPRRNRENRKRIPGFKIRRSGGIIP